MRASRGFWLYGAFLSSLFLAMAVAYLKRATILGGGRIGPIHETRLAPGFGVVLLIVGIGVIGTCLYQAFGPRQGGRGRGWFVLRPLCGASVLVAAFVKATPRSAGWSACRGGRRERSEKPRASSRSIGPGVHARPPRMARRTPPRKARTSSITKCLVP